MAILFAILAYIGWGVGDIIGVIYTRKVGGYATTLWSYIFRTVLFAFAIPFLLPTFGHLTVANISLTIILSIIFIIGVAISFEAYESTNASLVGTICASFVVPAIFLSVVFLHDTLRFPQLLAIFLIIIGLILSALDLDTFKTKKLVIDKGIKLAFIVMILWGIYFSFIQIPVKQLGWFLPSYAAYLVFPVVFLAMRMKKIAVPAPTKNHGLLALLGFTALSSLGNVAYNLGIARGYVSVVVPIAGSYPTIFVLLAFLIFKDKLKKSQWLGIIVSLVGIVTMSFLSV